MTPTANLRLEYLPSLHSEWFTKLISSMSPVSIKKNIVWFPKYIGTGGSLFCKILPEVSVLVFDAVLSQKICFDRLPTNGAEDFWILCYDLHNRECVKTNSANAKQNQNLFKSNVAILDSNTSSSFLVKEGVRNFSLRILIKKDFLHKFLIRSGIINQDFNRETAFFKAMDSRSKVLLNSLKKYRLDSMHYELLLKAVVYNLLGFFTEKQSIPAADFNIIYDRDREAIIKSNEYLLSDLSIPFPGLEELVKVANMSVTKYRVLYKSIVGTTPLLFFRQEKLKQAKIMLESGNYKWVADVAFDLGYSKVAYFSKIYKSQFHINPCESLKSTLHTDDR